MGGFIRLKTTAAWMIAAACCLSLAALSSTAAAKLSTRRNLKSYLQSNAKQVQRKESFLSVPSKIQQSSRIDLPSNNYESSFVGGQRPVRTLKGGMMGKGGKGYSDDDDGYGKGKGKMKSGKKKGKSNKGKSKKGKGSGLPHICEELDFGQDNTDDDYFGKGKGKGKGQDNTDDDYVGKGKGKGKGFRQNRDLQYEGALCEPNVFDTAKGISDLTIFVSLIEQAGLEEIFLCAGPFTVLAPSNAAFVNNPSVTKFLAESSNKKELRDVLLYHILPGLTLTDEFTSGPIEALQGDAIEVTVDPVMFNDKASIEEGDIIACNGAINIINNILLPPGISILPDICSELDFSSSYDRRLQMDGALCDPNVLETMRENDDLSTFVQLLEVAGLAEIFKCPGPFTCLAPTNEAFDSLDSATLAELLLPDNKDKLRNLLLYHFIPGLYLAEDFEEQSLPTLLENESVAVTIDPVLFNGRAKIVEEDIIACNGVIQAIDDVLVPESDLCQMYNFDGDTEGANCMPNLLEVARALPEFALTVTLIERAGLDEIFNCAGPFTGLFPTNDAWDDVDSSYLEQILRPENADQLEELLLYHVLPGSYPSASLDPGPIETLSGESVEVSLNPIMFNDAEVSDSDILACNGLLYALRSTLLGSNDTPTPPPADTPIAGPMRPPIDTPVSGSPSPVAVPTAAPVSICAMYDFGGATGGEGCTPNILDTARDDPDLSLAVILFERAGLTDILSCPGPFTVQLPTNEAIENVDASLLDFLLRPENQDELMNLMLYHILPGSFPTSALKPGPTPTLANDGEAEVIVSKNPTMFNNSTVIMADISACNGLINTIDSILTFLPTTPTASPTALPETASPMSLSPAPTKAPVPISISGPPSLVPAPIGQPSDGPSIVPNVSPPVDLPVDFPVDVPVDVPVDQSSDGPSSVPNVSPPVDVPVDFPVDVPVDVPVDQSSDGPSSVPNVSPPVDVPVDFPVDVPVDVPVDQPSDGPSSVPNVSPPVDAPVDIPVDVPVDVPVDQPSDGPSSVPNVSPPVDAPVDIPVDVPVDVPVGQPSDGPSSVPVISPDTEPPVLRIRVENFFIAYATPGATTEPTEDDYAQLVDITNEFFTDNLTARFADDDTVTFLRTESVLGFTLFGQGIPAERFNIYTDYNYTDLIYTANSTPPNAAESFVLLRESINTQYITDYVRTITAFATTNEVLFRASTMEPPVKSEPLQKSSSEGTDAITMATVAATSAAALLILAAGILVFRKKRAARRRGEALYDGVYADDAKATLEGYFTERSVTDTSETVGKLSTKLSVANQKDGRPVQVRV